MVYHCICLKRRNTLKTVLLNNIISKKNSRLILKNARNIVNIYDGMYIFEYFNLATFYYD